MIKLYFLIASLSLNRKRLAEGGAERTRARPRGRPKETRGGPGGAGEHVHGHGEHGQARAKKKKKKKTGGGWGDARKKMGEKKNTQKEGPRPAHKGWWHRKQKGWKRQKGENAN